MQVKDLLKLLNKIAPFDLAEEYDNCGLIVGSGNKEVAKIFLALDLTKDSLKEAIDSGADVVITHHPLIFNPIKRIDTDGTDGEIIAALIKKDMAYIAMHTNMDKVKGGMNDYLAELVGIEKPMILEEETKGCHICVYVPTDYRSAVKKAVFDSGAGVIGDYEGCCFEIAGKGEFKAGEKATPFVSDGQGVTTKADECMLQFYCPKERVDEVVSAMVGAHPYEKPYYYCLDTRTDGNCGFGRYGLLPKPMALKAYCAFVKEKLNLPRLQYTGDDSLTVRTVGVCTGAGGSLYPLAVAKGVDAFITGDIKHSVSVLASQNKTALINGEHFETEEIFKNVLGHHLQNYLNEVQYNVCVVYSSNEKSPWKQL